jgi:hypothetical protein
MNAALSRCVWAFVLFAIPFSSVRAEPLNAATAEPVDSCPSYFAPGAGGDIKYAVRKLQVDLGHGVSMMMLPGFAAAAYAVSLEKGAKGEWKLTYAIDNSFSPSRPYRASVPFLSVDDAQRIEKVWITAIAEAKPRPSASSGELECIRLDGMSYVFSANGRQANNFAGQGAIPRQLVEIASTLRLIAADTRNTGHAVVSSFDDLSYQLNRIEGDLKINSH